MPRLNTHAVVVQPTTICNLNCSYCYLPNRRDKRFMSDDVVLAISESIARSNVKSWVFWHGGEPLAAGIKRFSSYMELFQRTGAVQFSRHNFQTNATLLNEEWCEFIRTHNIRIGVSLDGDAICNASRVDWSGRPTFERTLRGIQELKRAKIDFSVICVVNKHNLDRASEIYSFIDSLSPRSLSINVEETEGHNSGSEKPSSPFVSKFWDSLLACWLASPNLPIRQFTDAYAVLDKIHRGEKIGFNRDRYVYPTVSVDGDVMVLSPELMSVVGVARERFMLGNVLREKLENIVDRARDVEYVREFFSGLKACESQCQYWEFCGGGQASNRYFETGRLDGTVTDYCTNSRIAPVESVLHSLEA